MTTIYTSKDVLLSAINAKLGLTIDVTKYELTNVQSTPGEHNSSVDIVPLIGSGGYNKSLFKYNRMDLAGFDVVPVKMGSSTRVSDLMGSIADTGGIYTMIRVMTAGVESYVKVGITAADIVNNNLPIVTGSDTVLFQVEAKESSYLFYGLLILELSA